MNNQQQLHDGNILRSLLGAMLHRTGDIGEHYDRACAIVENLEAQIIRLSEENKELKSGRRTGEPTGVGTTTTPGDRTPNPATRAAVNAPATEALPATDPFALDGVACVNCGSNNTHGLRINGGPAINCYRCGHIEARS